jgi:hypothetical protein
LPQRTFKSGEIAPVSGVYLTYHWPHAEGSEIFIEKSKEFHCCLKCLRQITFKLLEPATLVPEKQGK